MSGGLLSSITSLFGGAPDSTSNRKSSSSVFGSGFPSSSRRGPPSRLDDAAWSLPYNYANGANNSSSPLASPLYPPPPGSAASFNTLNGAASDSVAHLASQSSHTLVNPPQPAAAVGGIRSTMDARTPTGLSIPSTSFPPLRHTWNRIRTWSESHYPELKDTLNWPATEAQLDELEYAIGFSLPAAVRQSYLCFNGQELESNQSCGDGIFFGLPLLSLEQIAEEWKFWRAVDDDPTSGASDEVRQWQSSCPDKWVRAQYSCRGWIPLITDRVGNYIGVDVTPHPSGGGAPGQMILFGRDFDTKVVLWRGEGEGGWGRFLQYVAEELESGEMWTLEELSSGSEDEEDAIGYESYFSGGGSGSGRGGGDRGGEGSAGFRLTGEYRGWPVLEAWADRSMRCWEEVGLLAGVPFGQGEMPSVRLSGVDENGESIDAEGSARRSTSSGSSTHNRLVDGDVDHPLQGESANPDDSLNGSMYGRPFSPSNEPPPQPAASTSQDLLETRPQGRRISDTLSPPPASVRGGASRNKQKHRDGGDMGAAGTLSASSSSSRQSSSARRRPPPPAPAQPLDLPTIDDVRAARAAALAAHERSTQVQYSDLENSTAGLSLGRNGTIRAASGQGPQQGGAGRGTRSSEALELDSRSFGDGRRTTSGLGVGGGPLSDVVVVGSDGGRRSMQSPSPRGSTDRERDSRDRVRYDSPSTNLMDGSAPNSPSLGSGAAFPGGVPADYVASPLSHSYVGRVASVGEGGDSAASTPTKAKGGAVSSLGGALGGGAGGLEATS
ncbi:hypothetical protein BDZ90DRAFT_279326 [Jaminaea rosea]|uniref:Knr4/Smi1-like domain-containing protein n=1 Tax=Jaminaea rosea TaxID=1569628 RepID=A0A316UT73_9BASI|nr:hypothetical protein BDZ90DRAFT_279326 [Jaminaea rosea]PWN28204.1 hypothetical protein BDZ90DRAFT_279326 [Jaminaea rosea]